MSKRKPPEEVSEARQRASREYWAQFDEQGRKKRNAGIFGSMTKKDHIARARKAAETRRERKQLKDLF